MTDHTFPSPPFDAHELGALAAIGLSYRGRRSPACPDPAVVLAAGEGVLDEVLAARVLAHVAACPACQLAAADLGRVFDDGVPAESRRRIDARLAAVRPRGVQRGWFWLVPAGGLAVATAVIIDDGAVASDRCGGGDPRRGPRAARFLQARLQPRVR